MEGGRLMMSYHIVSAEGELCGMCWRENEAVVSASHKVEEEFIYFDNAPRRHPLTQYICCDCFQRIMGPLAKEWCKELKKGGA